MVLLTRILPFSRKLSGFHRKSAIVIWTRLARETPSSVAEWKPCCRLTNRQASSLADLQRKGHQRLLLRCLRWQKNRVTALAIISCCNKSVRADAGWFTWLNRRHRSAGGSL